LASSEIPFCQGGQRSDSGKGQQYFSEKEILKLSSDSRSAFSESPELAQSDEARSVKDTFS
jgi:hypothetical protein